MHEVLEYGGGVNKSIRHDAIFVVARRSHEGGLPLVPLTYPDEVVCAAEVQLGEETCSAKLLQCSRDEGKWIPELDCNLIQTPIIYARPQTTILLCHKEEARSSRGCRWSDVALLESFLYVLLHGLLFRNGEWVYSPTGHWLTWKQIDGTVPWPIWRQLRGLFRAEYITEGSVAGWNIHRLFLHRALNGGGADLEMLGNLLWRMRKMRETVREAAFAPLQDLTRLPGEDVVMLHQPRAP